MLQASEMLCGVGLGFRVVTLVFRISFKVGSFERSSFRAEAHLSEGKYESKYPRIIYFPKTFSLTATCGTPGAKYVFGSLAFRGRYHTMSIML